MQTPDHRPVAWLPAEATDHLDPSAFPLIEVEPYQHTDRLPRFPDRVEVYVLPYPFRSASLAALDRLPRLRVVQALYAGVDQFVDTVPARLRLHSAPVLHTEPTAETALTLLLALLNGVPAWVDAQRARTWSTPPPRARLAGRTVGVVGYGRIGQAVARMLTGFGVRVVPVASTARDGVRPVSELVEVAATVDALVLALPLTERTRGLVGAEVLAAMRPGAVLVNVGRGPVVDTQALLPQLASGRLLAGLDVVDPEPLPEQHPLWDCPGVLISPHVGGVAADLWERAGVFLTEQLARYAAGQPLLHPVGRG